MLSSAPTALLGSPAEALQSNRLQYNAELQIHKLLVFVQVTFLQDVENMFGCNLNAGALNSVSQHPSGYQC